MQNKFFVAAEWDEEAGVWYVAESDVPGLAADAPTIDELLTKLKVMVPEMLEVNGMLEHEHAEVPFSLMAAVAGAASHC